MMDGDGMYPYTRVYAVGCATASACLYRRWVTNAPALWPRCWPCLSGGRKPLSRMIERLCPSRVGLAVLPAPFSVGMRNRHCRLF
jgi:hypothetical protein